MGDSCFNIAQGACFSYSVMNKVRNRGRSNFNLSVEDSVNARGWVRGRVQGSVRLHSELK